MSLRGRIVIGSMALGLTACPNYLFEQKFPTKVKEMQIVVPAATPVPADILFVVDDSCSMDDKQANLRMNFQAFIDQVAGTGDYQIAVITTDNVNGIERTGVSKSSFEMMAPFNLTTLDVGNCSSAMIPQSCFRGPDAAKRIIQGAKLTRDEQIAAFQDNAAVGSCGSGIETGLKAISKALAQTRPGGCNEGFLRQEANLVIVVLSDENDTDATPVDQYVNDIGQYKDYGKVRVAMIVGSEDGEAQNCKPDIGADCGKMGCMPRQPDGSGMPCMRDDQCPGPSSTEPQGESCQANQMGQKQCLNKAYGPSGGYDPNFCGWCTFYNAPDCCYALKINNPFIGEPGRYIEYARKMEAKIAPAAMLQTMNCRAPAGTPAACLVDTICQNNFSDTLKRIATELVITNTYKLNPATNYPPGVAVHISGGVHGDAGCDLRNCAAMTDPNDPKYCPSTGAMSCDFNVDAGGGTVTISGPNTPKEGETVQIYFIVPS